MSKPHFDDTHRRAVLEVVHSAAEGTLQACRRADAVRRLLEEHDSDSLLMASLHDRARRAENEASALRVRLADAEAMLAMHGIDWSRA